MARTISKTITIRQHPDKVAYVVTDMEQLAKYMVGFSRFEPVGDLTNAKGAEYEVYLDIGTIYVGGRVKITEYDPQGRLAWTSIRGTRHSFSLQAEAEAADQTRLEISLRYELAGKLLARLSERLGGTILNRNLEASTEKLRHHLEFEL